MTLTVIAQQVPDSTLSVVYPRLILDRFADHNWIYLVQSRKARLRQSHKLKREGSNSAKRYLQVEEHAARDVLAGTSLREECVEGVVASANGLVGGHLAIGLNA